MDIVYEAIKKIPGITDYEAHEVATKLGSREHLAPKSDIFELKAEMQAIKAELQAVEAKIQAMAVEMQTMKWAIGLVFVMNVAVFIKLFF